MFRFDVPASLVNGGTSRKMLHPTVPKRRVELPILAAAHIYVPAACTCWTRCAISIHFHTNKIFILLLPCAFIIIGLSGPCHHAFSFRSASKLLHRKARSATRKGSSCPRLGAAVCALCCGKNRQGLTSAVTNGMKPPNQIHASVPRLVYFGRSGHPTRSTIASHHMCLGTGDTR